MTTKEIIEILKERERDYLKTKSFSQQSGIYAFFFIGNDFPLLGDKVKRHEILYIGKTESSQEKRNAKTHFTTGKTGGSTVRKSVGSILRSTKNLVPIPRNNTDYREGRFGHFKFDNESEEIITEWMKNNLGLSFFEYSGGKEEISEIEMGLINELIPVLNISKNPKNPFKGQLLKLRENCASMARKMSNFSLLQPKNIDSIDKPIKINITGSMTSNLIFIDNITENDFVSKQIRITVDNKHLFPSERLGNPINHNLIFVFGNKEYAANYRIGSKDGKSRSGVLKLDKELYLDILKIKRGANLKICKIDSNKYTIKRN